MSVKFAELGLSVYLCKNTYMAVTGIKCHYMTAMVLLYAFTVATTNNIIYKQGGSLCSPPAAPDLNTFHRCDIATYLHTYTCMLKGVVNGAVKGQTLQAGGLASLAPCCTRFRYLPSHSYIPAHIHMNAIRCCKQGCVRVASN